jgi:hypothetical protein
MLLLMHLHRLLCDECTALFAGTFRPKKNLMTNARDRQIPRNKNRSHIYDTECGFLALENTNDIKAILRKLNPHMFYQFPSPLWLPRNSIANFIITSNICADFDMFVFVKGSVCIATSMACSIVARCSGVTMNSKPQSM